jgi:high affinity sulfate transporter 1
MVTRWIPGLSTIKSVKPSAIPRELGAGLSVAAVAIPIGLAYAKLVGVPPEIGLYASIFPTLAYALFGPSSRYLIVGPDTATALLLGTTITGLGIVAIDARVSVAAELSLLVGISCIVASKLRLGFIANLISKPVLIGYLAGIALKLVISQLPSVTHVALKQPGLLRPFIELARRQSEIHWPSVALAAGLFILLRTMKRVTPRIPGPAVAVAIALILSITMNFKALGFALIGHLPTGLPSPHIPAFGGDSSRLIFSVAGLVVISFAAGILAEQAFAARVGAKSDPNRELAGFGIADLAAALFQGFAVTGTTSRTAVAVASGGQTALVGITTAACIALVITVFTGPLALLPDPALGAIILSAAIDLIDVKSFRRLAKVDWHELAFALVATAGVIWIGVLEGVFIAVLLTLLNLLRIASRPQDRIMGRHAGSGDLVSVHRYPDAVLPEQIVVYLFEANLIFLNAQYFCDRILAVLAAQPDAKWLVIDASVMFHSDIGAVEALEELKADLDKMGVTLLIGGGHGDFRDILDRSGLVELIGPHLVFATPGEALVAAEALRDAKRRAGGS